MTFNWDVNIATIVTIALSVVGFVAGLVQLRVQSKSTADKTEELDKRISGQSTQLNDLRLHVSEQCVKKTDLEKVEDRLTRRLDAVEHTIRNSMSTLMGTLAAMGSSRKLNGSE